MVLTIFENLVNNFRDQFNQTALLVISTILSIATTILVVLFIIEITKMFAMRRRGEDTGEIVTKIMLYGTGMGLFAVMSTFSWGAYLG